MENFIGKFISIQSDKGAYQGQIIDVTKWRVTLDKAFCDGRPCQNQPVTILSQDIKDLKLLDAPTVPLQSHFRVERPLAVKAQTPRKTEVTPSRQSPKRSDMACPSPRKVDVTAARRDRRLRWVDKDEEAFGSPIDIRLQPDFDFEKNLALFDKKAVYEEINASKPDLVRQVDKKANRYKCNENVLENEVICFRQISVPEPQDMEFVTDSGLVVPAVPHRLRRQILALAEDAGLSFPRQAELMGRATTELVLQLLGGAHRLNPLNEHQCPSVVIIAGCHRAGAVACNSARQMAGHGVRTTLYIKGEPTIDISTELRLLRLTNCRVTNKWEDLIQSTVDLTVMAWADPSLQTAPSCSVSQWAQSIKAPVLALDPPVGGTRGLSSKISLTAPLPMPYDSSNGRIYLCNLSIPSEVYRMAGVDYQSPFGPKFVIPLHPNDG